MCEQLEFTFENFLCTYLEKKLKIEIKTSSSSEKIWIF